MIRVATEYFHKVKGDVKVTGVALEMDREGFDLLWKMMVEAKQRLHDRSVEQKPPSSFVVSTPWVGHENGDEMHQLKLVEV